MITLAIIGWVLLGVCLIQLSCAAFLVYLNGAGKYNIGGVANSIATKIFANLFALADIALIYWWVVSAPFKISMDIL